MKTFLYTSLGILALAVAAAIIVFTYIQYQLAESQKSLMNTEESVSEQHVAPAIAEPVPTDSAAAAVPESGIPLKDVPLSDTQKSVLETINVDPETFVITPGMVLCAEGVLGAQRLAEIQAGAAVSIIEGLSLTKCIQQ